MKGVSLKNLSANTLQLLLNQGFGLLIFFILSTGLDKNTFGQLNLSLAILLSVFNILSFGIDQVVVQKIAAGNEPAQLLSVYLFHVVLSGGVFYSLLALLYWLAPQMFGAYQLLVLVGAGKLMVYFSTPFKQLAAGFEKFALLARMSVVSNIARGCALLILILLHTITINTVFIVFIGGDTLELLATVVLFKYRLQVSINIGRKGRIYLNLLKESFPQVGVVLFTSALARFDWIFIGLWVSATKLAEYSFAYKIFEMSTLPLLALAPMLVPRFTQILKLGELPVAETASLIRLEMLVATFTGLVLSLCWSPLMDSITAGKYGQVNYNTMVILAFCLPLMYLNNLLWSAAFAKGRLKMILGVIAITFGVNLLGDVVWIPILKNEGAALAYLAAMLVQCGAYLHKNDMPALKSAWLPLLLCTLCAIGALVIAKTLFPDMWYAAIMAIGVYVLFLLFTRQIRMSDIKSIGHIFN